MAASMLSGVYVTLRGPAAFAVAPIRVQWYSAGLTVSGAAAVHRKRPGQRGGQRKEVPPPRTEKMLTDQEWSNVYPTAASFKPSAVPLPVRMGYPKKKAAPPDKIGNLELLKISNFLHLTPTAIKKHCAMLKEFCTPWPASLTSDDSCTQHFPIELQSVDYVFAGPSLRNPKARAVTLQIKLSSLNLDNHARKKLIKLVGSRYNAGDDILTIRTDRCPVRKQNQDYALYLLTVLYHESWKTEAWESEKEESDMDEYIWEGSKSQQNVLNTLTRSLGNSEDILQAPNVQEYRRAMLNLRNQGETEESIRCYKQSVKNLLGVV
ncbi:28S ribosomal protein S35, mitochondrial [Bufo bufo]|uniref:28S ribosomal protein S35, mitochondrial n=1 Tax=Bufo bufo TaxID=8384 RepID=UPI001ABE00CC|nr:28S ribosomal protein S35, mitochondrial [Bufo bufo]